MSEERAFIENWWKRKFSMPNLPAGDDVIITGRLLGRDTVYVESVVPLIAEAAIQNSGTQH